MSKTAGRKKRKFVVGTALVTLIAAGAVFSHYHSKGRSVTYSLTEVNRGTVRSTILSTGTVAPENRLDLKAPVAGRVEQVLVEEGQWVKGGQVLAWMSSTERATLIDAARSKGPEEVKYWEDSYKRTPILAPMKGGLIILKNADAGQTVTQTDIILSMSDHLVVKANVDETDLADVKPKMRVNIILDAFPGDPMPGKVFHVGYDAKTVNNVTTYEVDVIADKTPKYMKSGMTANVTFLVAEKDNALLVPAASIHRGKHHSYVMLPDPKNPGETIRKEVELGISDGKKVEVISGLAEGERVLTAAVRSLAKGEHDTSPFGSPFGSRPGGGGAHK